MKILQQEAYNYRLIFNQNKYQLIVLCGSSGLFEITYDVTEEIINEFLNNPEKLNELIKKIRLNPDKYINNKNS